MARILEKKPFSFALLLFEIYTESSYFDANDMKILLFCYKNGVLASAFSIWTGDLTAHPLSQPTEF